MQFPAAIVDELRTSAAGALSGVIRLNIYFADRYMDMLDRLLLRTESSVQRVLVDKSVPENGKASSQENVNSLGLSTRGMLLTFLVNVVLFVLLMLFFEFNRHYKQIFLKRYQNKFIKTGRVPEKPPDHMFGWLVALWTVPEEPDFLNMVGLDAFVLLRFHVLCIKLSVFVSFWGYAILLPTYCTVPTDLVEWDKYTLLNVVGGQVEYQQRLWVTALTFYVFAAYFCKLLHVEFETFSTHRLKFLSSTNPEDDPDTNPQKYYTVMLENIPMELRSHERLREYFHDLFPDQVYTVELSLDLRELNALAAKRKQFRDSLEKAIAVYNVTSPRRPKVYVRTKELGFNIFDFVPDDSVESLLAQFVDPARYGYEKLDAINYYTAQLGRLNEDTMRLQGLSILRGRNMDAEIRKRVKKFDTRAAEALASFSNQTGSLVENISKPNGFLETFFFGDQNGLQTNSNAAGIKKGGKGSKSAAKEDTNVKVLNKVGGVKKKKTKDGSESPVKKGQEKKTKKEKAAKEKGKKTAPITILNAPRDDDDAAEPSPSSASSARRRSGSGGSATVNVRPFEEGNSELLRRATGDSDDIESGSISQSRNRFNTAFTQEMLAFEELVMSKADDKDRPGKGEEEDDGEEEEQSFYINLEDELVYEGGGVPVPVTPSDEYNAAAIDGPTGMRLDMLEANIARSPQNSEFTVVSELSSPSIEYAEQDAAAINSPSIVASSSKSSLSTLGLKGGSSSNLRKASMASIAESLSDNMAVNKTKATIESGWIQTKVAIESFAGGILEAERAVEMVVVGAHYQYSSTAFVTFTTRMAETIAHQMHLTDGDSTSMEINHAPNPTDIIWENVFIPKSQITMRTTITNVGLAIGAFFWSSLVNSVNHFAKSFQIPENQQNFLSVVILLVFLLILPFIFDFIARHYECMKLESEIQNSIMTRYFYYQLVNIYVTVGLGGINIGAQLLLILRHPQTLVEILGSTIPSVSLYFTNLVIVKIFTAIPIEMLRPWQLSTILLIGTIQDRRKTTRRELRTGAFFAWPMLYGWIYPQLMMVQMIVITYASISPLLMPFGALFFGFAYLMYKYQLLYVYVNDYQSHGYMWYMVFNFSIIGLLFATATLLGYLGLHFKDTYSSGPFFFLLPLPVCIVYFWNFCDHKFKKKMNLSYLRARHIDRTFADKVKRRNESAASPPWRQELMIPQDSFDIHLFRQPTLTEKPQFPEPYRSDSISENTILVKKSRGRKRATSIDMGNLIDDFEETDENLGAYWETVLGTLLWESENLHPLEVYKGRRPAGSYE